LIAFAKTNRLAPGESQTLSLSVNREQLASFDDAGLTAHKDAYVLQQGSYRFFLGGGLHDLKEMAYTLELGADEVIQQLSEKLVPTSLPKRLRADGSYEQLPTGPARDPNECIFPKMKPGTEEGLQPACRGYERQFRYTPYAEGVRPFIEVYQGKITLDEFLAQLSDEDLIHLLGGQPNTGVANTFGFGNLPEYGVPNIMTADGPAGLRIQPQCGVSTTAFPCGTLLASTWNPEIVEAVGAAGGAEVKENNIAVWLTPAINIHRNPYCGRNFEYYSEDPLLAGFTASAMVRGIQSNHVAASVKHFAVNNKEINRKNSDSRVSQRAVREIYLKAFEITVKTADPWTIMSSYNIVNGIRASENKELLEDILRDEWGFKGLVTSDWWTRGEHYKELLAGNDIKMGCGFPERVKQAMDMGAVTRNDLLHCAKRVLELILKID
jgi:beta-glucosidase